MNKIIHNINWKGIVMGCCINDLRDKEVINVNDGKNIGTIIDANINDDGIINTLIIEQNKNLFSLNRESDIEVSWKDITKIGTDVILIKISSHE